MNNPMILVVEDDAPVRNLIVTTLKTHDQMCCSSIWACPIWTGST